MKPVFDYDLFPDVLLESYFKFDGEDFLYFPEGVEFYTLYRNGRKINSFAELMYIGEVLLFLNSNMEYDKFLEMMLWVSDRDNKQSIRTYSEGRVIAGCDYVFRNKKKPYINKYRKIIFNPLRRIPFEEKMVIVGSVCRSSKVNDEVIYNVVEELMYENQYITINLISETLQVTRQTVSKHITDGIKEIIKDFNDSLTT